MTNNNETNQNYASHDSVEASTEEVLNIPTKRKRTRMVKKDAVYTVNGMDAENLDSARQRRTAKKRIQEIQQMPLFSTPESLAEETEEAVAEPEEAVAEPEEVVAEPEEVVTEPEEVVTEPEEVVTEPEEVVAEPEEAKEEEQAVAVQDPSELFKPHRGRKSKAELAAIAAWEAQQALEKADSENSEDSESPESPETSDSSEDSESSEDSGRTELAFSIDHKKLEAAMNRQQNMPQENEEEDFIIVQDIPVEDIGAITSYDMLDNPINVPETTPHKPSTPASETNNNSKRQFNFDDIIKSRGVLEMMPDGYGFIRSSEYNYISSPDDVYVSNQMVKKFGLKVGDVLECTVRPPMDGEKFFTLTGIDFINGRKPHEVRDRIPFEHLTPLFPDVKFTLCGDPRTTNKSVRIVDLFSPIGKGQRALIVAQPKTGKTILMKDIANAIAANHPEAYLMMLLIDERPEEVTDMARTVNAEVIASTFDEPADKHVKIAGLVLEKAKRMVECGHDVVIFLDSITRLARAYNTVAPASGKILTGGVDASALQKPKRFFGAARNIEGGGSLTIIATALIDTGSKMDEVIFEEFKGTGNMELQLERALSNKRIFPSVNLVQSSTRRDDLLHDKNTLDKMWIMRKYIADMNSIEAMNIVQQHMDRTRDNDEFLMSMNS